MCGDSPRSNETKKKRYPLSRRTDGILRNSTPWLHATCQVRCRLRCLGSGRGGFTNENYLSMVALIRFGSFDYLWASDLGGGHMDEACTGRSTNQVNLETPLAKALTPGGTTPACTREASRAARFAILSSLSSTLLAAKTLRSQTPFRRGRVSMRRI